MRNCCDFFKSLHDPGDILMLPETVLAEANDYTLPGGYMIQFCMFCGKELIKEVKEGEQ